MLSAHRQFFILPRQVCGQRVAMLSSHTDALMDEMLHRVPALRETEIRQIVNGPESFTPDGLALVGEAPEVFITIHSSSITD